MGSNRTTASHSHIDIVTPLLNGCITGQLKALFYYCNRSIISHLIQVSDDPNRKKMMPDFKIPIKTMLRIEYLAGVTYTIASLGTFEILTMKLRNTNDGMPLTLYEEACCGLTSGAIAAFVWRPFRLASSQTAAENWTYRNLFSTLCRIVRTEGVMTLWKDSGLFKGRDMPANMGMLASYSRSLNLFHGV